MSDVLAISKVADVFLAVNDSALQAKANALDISREVTAITNPTQLSIAVAALQDLTSLVRSTEKSRETVKRPVFELGKRIDATAKGFIADVEKEQLRIKMLISDFETQARREREAQERKVREEAARLEQERIKAMQDAERAKTVEEFQRNKDKAEQLKAEASAVIAAVVEATPKVEGLNTSKAWDYTITDPLALYQKRPDFFDLVPKRRSILDAIRAGGRGYPGIHIFETTSVRV